MRVDSLTTKGQTARVLMSTASGRVIIFCCLLAAAVRMALGPLGWTDVQVVTISISLVGLVEWFIHLFLLHAPPASVRMRILKTGSGHRQHHLDPPELRWVVLGGGQVMAFAVMIAVLTTAWVAGLLVLVERWTGPVELAPVVVSAVLVAYVLLAHYEWTHLLVHTRYRPTTRYYRRLARNHRLHHYRNENYWLGVTSNLGDRILRTYPAHRSDVELSQTARTLG